MIVERLNARTTSKNPWLTQPRRQFPHASRLNFTPSDRLTERRPRTSPQPGQSQARFYISRRLKQIHPSRRRARWRWRWRWRLRGQPQMREDAGDGGRILDGRDELQLPAAVRAAPDVDIEHALQQLRPMHAPFALPTGRWAQSPACMGAGALAVGGTGTGTTALRSVAFGASTP